MDDDQLETKVLSIFEKVGFTIAPGFIMTAIVLARIMTELQSSSHAESLVSKFFKSKKT